MAISDSVALSIAVSLSAAPAVQSLSTPLVAAYHTHYAARFKQYPAAGGAGLAAMLLDGFTVNDAAYKAASAICSQNPSPSTFAIGRRALAPLQTLALSFLDATVGDAYAFTLIGGLDGLSHQVTYTVPANPGARISTATVALTNGSAAAEFSTTQTMAAGDALVFTGQPGVYYFVANNINAGTSVVLTAPYQGATNASTTASRLATLAGTFATTNGSNAVPTTTTQVGAVSAGDSLVFASQPGAVYTVFSVASGVVTLSAPYMGITASATHAVDVATVGAAATAIGASIASYPNLGTVTVAGNVVTIARSDGRLNDVQGWRANGFANIALQDLTADPGLATDLAAIYSADSMDWYALVLDSNSAAEDEAAARWVEATGIGGKVFFGNTSDTPNTDPLASSDLFSTLQTLGYKRSHLEHNGSQLLSFAGASNAAWALARAPGSYVIAQGATKPGVPADTEVTLPETAALTINGKTANTPTSRGKGGNFYKVTAGINASFWGMTPAGGFVDLTLFLDWLYLNMQADVFGVLAGLPKVPYTPSGVGLITDAVDTRLRIGAAKPYGGIDATQPITVTAPNPATVAGSDKAAGNLPGVGFSAFYTNGIVTVEITGNLVI